MIPTARHEELKQAGHAHLDTLLLSFPEKKIRRGLSRHMGLRWNYHNMDSGFHFSHRPSLKDMEKAVAWLALAAEQNSLTPRIEKKDPMLMQTDMRAALAALPQHKKLSWWRRLFV